MKTDYIIVGQGLAGSAVALQLLKRGRSVMVFDEGQANTSSRIAAGMFNPITGKRMLRTWMAKELFPYLSDFYKDAERITGSSFFFPKTVYRPFINAAEHNDWMVRSADQDDGNFVESVVPAGTVAGVHDPFGGVRLKHSGYLNTSAYVEAVRNLLKQKDFMREERLQVDELVLLENSVSYRDVHAEAVIFCDGISVLQNPHFRGLAVTPLKGETLTIKTEWSEDVILNRGVYMVPGKAGNEYRVGSTYDYQDSEPATTDRARAELIQRLEAIFQGGYEITGQDFGFRPTTADRRPIVGRHPVHKTIMMLNGLGTKGVSLAPYFSEVLVRYMENQSPIPGQADVTRFKLLY